MPAQLHPHSARLARCSPRGRHGGTATAMRWPADAGLSPGHRRARCAERDHNRMDVPSLSRLGHHGADAARCHHRTAIRGWRRNGLAGKVRRALPFAGMNYWSVTDQTWQTLIIGAFAVTDSGGQSRRGDFRPDEMAPGVSLYAAQRDGRAADAVIYRMQVIEHSVDRGVVSVGNASPLR